MKVYVLRLKVLMGWIGELMQNIESRILGQVKGRRRCRFSTFLVFIPLRALASVFLIAMIGGCSSSDVKPSSQQEVVVIERFVGELPCEGCRLVRADITLKRDEESGQPDGFFMHRTRVDGAEGNVSSTRWGDWRQEHRDDAIYYCLDARPQEITFQLSEEGERLLWVAPDSGRSDEELVGFVLRQAEPLL